MTIEEIKKKYGNEFPNQPGYVSCNICPLNKPEIECKSYISCCDGYENAYRAIQRYFAEQETLDQFFDQFFIEAEPDKSSKVKSVRKEILEAAINCVCTDRGTQYGSPEDSFKVIAKLWSDYTGYEITPHDAAVMMALLKVARIKTGRYKDDSYIDAAGYIACAAEIGRCNNE